jgi:hypothetical protein
MEDKIVRSRYPEDQYINDHTTVWGSWFNKTLQWGYQCCHSNEKYSNCLGRRGMKIAVIKEYKIIRSKETAMLKNFDAGAEGNNQELTDVQNFILKMEAQMQDQNIHISNLEGEGTDLLANDRKACKFFFLIFDSEAQGKLGGGG